MNNPALIALVQNAALLLALVVVFDLASGRQPLAGRPRRQILIGLVLGGLCMALIHSSFRLESGIIFDTRSVLLSVSGLFFGTLPTCVAMLVAAAFRLLKGGVGAWTGVAVTLATGAIGIAWRRFRKGRLQDISARELYVFGIVVHLVMLALMLTLPWVRAQHVLHDISLPVLLIYPVAATVLGLLLANRLRREQATADLAASEERLRLALDAARMGTFDVDLPTRRMVWSRKHEELWGFKPGEFAGTFESFASRVHPDDLPGVQAEIERCRNARAPFAREFRVVWPDASVHWISSLGQFVHNDAGRPLCFRGAAMEITARKQADDLRRETDERFRNLILRSPVPTGMMESDGTISLINDRGRQLFGYTPADIPTVNDWWHRAFPDESYRQESMAIWNTALEQAIRENRIVEPREFTITAKDGSRHVVEVSGLPVPGGSLMATFIDVTARHAAEARQRHLTDVLRAIRNVNQLIVHEKDPAALVRQACELLTESRGYRSAWIGQARPDGPLRIAGEADGTSDMKALRTQLDHGVWPPCCRRALSEPGVVVVHNTQEACRGCALAGTYADQSAMAAAIRHDEQLYGVLVVALPRDLAADPEEQALFAEVASDIGFALHSIETEQQRQQAEAALRGSEAQLRLFIEHAPAALAMFDRDMRYLAVSRRWLADFGLADREVLGRPHYEIFPEIGEGLKQIHRRGLAGEVVRGNEDRFNRADGSVQYLRWEMHPWRDSRGDVGGIVIFTEDITQRKLAEEALRQNEARLATALDMAQAGYWEYDVAADIFTFNDHFYRVFKTTAAAVGGYRMSSAEYARRFCHPDDAPLVAREVAEVIASPDPNYSRALEHRILHDDGSVGHVAVKFFIVKDAQGRTVKTYGVNQNITARKQNEIQIQEAKEFLDRIIDLSPFAMWVADRKGTILRVNRALCNTIHLTADQVVGHYNVLADANLQAQGVMPQVRAVFERHVPTSFCIPWRAAAAGEVDFHGARDLYVDATLFPILDARGELANVVCQWVDVTLQKQAEQALRESEERFRTLVDSAPEGIFVQAEGRFLFLNPAMVRLLGAEKPEELAGTEILARIAPEFHAAVRDRIRHQREAGALAPPMDQEYLRLDGSRVPVETTAMSVTYANRAAHLVFVRDITARKRTEEDNQNLQVQLLQAQKMDSIGRLAGGVAHDFNNMLGVILGHADLALENLSPDRPGFNSLQEIRKAAVRSGELTRQLLAFARKQPVAPKVLDLNETIEGMFKMLRRLIGENIELAWHPCRVPATIRMDPSQIDQLLANLCVNARDAISGAGRITIETQKTTFDAGFCAAHPGYLPGDYIVLAVRDTGCGMDSETMLRLFEPFFTTKEIGKGTGLGLAMVYGIVKQNNGFINVDSEVGHGSTFRIHLPDCHADGTAMPAAEAPARPARGSETILLVEDEPSLLRMTMTMLEHTGYHVIPAATPAEAIRLATEYTGRIHLLITDVVMPEMNGHELARTLQSSHPRLKHLFMSGYTADAIAHHGVLDPGVHFIPKPFTPTEFARKIRAALADDSGKTGPA